MKPGGRAGPRKQSGHAKPQWLSVTGVLVIAALAATSIWQMNARLRMVTTQFNFSEAVYTAQQKLTARTLDPAAKLPASTGEWIALFNRQVPFAPDGGPAFIVNKQGNPATGAVGVSATDFGREVRLTRPAYGTLTEQVAVVSGSEALSANN